MPPARAAHDTAAWLIARAARARNRLGDLLDPLRLGDDLQVFAHELAPRGGLGAGHQDDVAEVAAFLLAQVRQHAVAAVAGEVGVDDDGAIAPVAQHLDGVPAVGGDVGLEVETLAGALDRRGDQRVVFDDQEFRHRPNLGRCRGEGKLVRYTACGWYFALPKPRIGKKIGGRRISPAAKPPPLPKFLAIARSMMIRTTKFATGISISRNHQAGFPATLSSTMKL